MTLPKAGMHHPCSDRPQQEVEVGALRAAEKVHPSSEMVVGLKKHFSDVELDGFSI